MNSVCSVRHFDQNPILYYPNYSWISALQGKEYITTSDLYCTFHQKLSGVEYYIFPVYDLTLWSSHYLQIFLIIFLTILNVYPV
jgi:hypothetical protein